MSIEKEDRTLEAPKQINDPDFPSRVEVALPVTISPSNIATPEETPGVRRFSQVIFQTNPDYIPSMSGKQYETVNTQVEREDTFHPDSHMFFCQ